MVNEMTYEEPVYRYRILRHDDLPEAHKASYRARGIDPDQIWSLYMSFHDQVTAEKALGNLQTDPKKPSWYTYKLQDAGEDAPTTITRPIY